MKELVDVAEVKALQTRSGNTRFVLRTADDREFTTFKQEIARQAVAAEGKRAYIEFHEQERNGFRNVYLDQVEVLDEDTLPSPDEHADEVAWKTALDAAPWLLGGEPEEPVPADDLYDRIQPFKERVAEDIRHESRDEQD